MRGRALLCNTTMIAAIRCCWDDGMLLTFDQPLDGFAGYGRLTYDCVVRRCNWQDGYEWTTPDWEGHEHLGVVRYAPSDNGFRFAEGQELAQDVGPAPAPVSKACLAHQSETVERWIMDTGCGTDLVSQADADRCAPASIHNGQLFCLQHCQWICQSTITCQTLRNSDKPPLCACYHPRRPF